ncbi:tubulin nucleotide-binding domain-like protein [Ophiobolus disseminans]|uniref:Tubulin nucleotide-binding domain-like protein n=1 Tax=Ophiobolus disseminans TaxID=1469910 RepID=A0A6A7A3E4_9PLEO|nr:tubulin nucleotide-binding domain-like protein [Ophiobolus disseminans]
MDFAKLMSAQINKGKNTTTATDSSKKYLKRSEIEAQRQAAYQAEQEAAETARREKSDRKRKAEEDEAEREEERREKRRRLAEESRRMREEEEDAEERKRRKRLGLPDLPPKKKDGEGDATPIPEEEDIPEPELTTKLRALDEPICLFGETHKQRLKRYKKRVGADSLAAIMTDGPIPTTLQLVPEKDMKIDPKVPKDKEGREFLFRQLASYFTMVLKEWDLTLARRDQDVKESYQGKQAYAAMVQARENMRPLFKKLEKLDLPDSILEPVVKIVLAAQERRYVDANDGYLRLSIGNAAWPIGVTMESYFTYPPEPESPVDHDILFRPGIAPDGSETFTPRALIYDLKGAFGSMRRINALYEAEDDRSILDQKGVWSSKPIVQRAPPIPQSTYQEHLDAGLDPPSLSTSTVRYWSDYSRVFYHPKSIVQLSEFDVNDKLMPFEKWEVGMELFEKLEREVDLVDRDLRPFIEECDGIQGLQIFTGVDDAWGGWASSWLERLRDEYGKLSIWTWGLGDHGANTLVTREKRMQQIVNSARSLQTLGEQSSVYIPMSNTPAKSPSYLSIDPTSPWHIGALQAIGVESMTISSRLRSSVGGRGTLQDLEDTINSTGRRRVAKLQMSIADPEVLSEEASKEFAHAEKESLMTSRHTSEADEQLNSFDIDVFTRDYRVASKSGKKEHVFGRAEASRGNWNASEESGGRDPHDRFDQGPALQRYTAPILFPLLDSYPASIFDVGSGQATKLAVHTGLTTSTAVADQIRALEQIVKRLVGIEEREALCNGLQVLAEEYDEGWDSGSDSDNDE